MALTIAIEGTGVIANCDAISDTAGGTWFEEGGGTISLSNDVYLIGGASIGGKYASKSGVHAIDKGSGLYDFTAGSGAQSGQLIYIWVAATAIGTLDTLSTYPFCIRISNAISTSSDTTYSDYLIAGNDDSNGWTGGWKCFVIDPTKTPSRNAGDTHANIIASVRCIGLWIDCNTSARADSFFVGGIVIGSGLRITGTSTTGWADTVAYCTDYATRGWGMFQEREGIYFSYGKTYIGDATSQAAAVSFADTGRVIQFGTSEYCTNAATGVWASSMDTDNSGIVIEDHASYTTTFSDGVVVGTDSGRSGTSFIGNDLLNVSMDLYGGNNAASVTELYGTTFKSLTGLLNSGPDSQHLFYACNFVKCAQFVPTSGARGAPVIRNCIFAETADLDAALLWDEYINIQDCNFIANTTGAAVEHPSNAGTPYTHTKLYYSGNTYDVLNSSGSAITVTKAGTPQSDPTSYEGSLVTFQGSVDVEITVKDTGGNLISNVQTAVYKTSDRTEIMNEDTVAGIATEAYTGATPVEVEVRCRKSSSGSTKYINYSSTQTISSSGLTLTVTMQVDPNNNATT